MSPYPLRETVRLAKGGQALCIWLSATARCDRDGATYAVATTERDLT